MYVDTQTRQEYEQLASLVVVAAYAFTNTRLMLLSEIGESYDPKAESSVIGKKVATHYSNLLGQSQRVTGFFEDKKFNTFAGQED